MVCQKAEKDKILQTQKIFTTGTYTSMYDEF